MDYRKLSTADVLAAGILGVDPPESEIPSDANLTDIDDDASDEAINNALSEGGIYAPMYYGCFQVWKTEGGFSGELFQYRSISDRFANLNQQEALDKINEWKSVCFG